MIHSKASAISMVQYHNIEFTKNVGAKIKSVREALKLEIENIVEMTGFHRNVIISIENGTNTDISHIAAIAFAMGLHPKELLNVEIAIKPRFSLSAVRKEKSKLTTRIRELITGGFFSSIKSSKEVQGELQSRFPESNKFTTKNISVILSRLADSGILVVSKKGNSRYNYYKRKK